MRIGIIGAGNMGRSIALGVLSKGLAESHHIIMSAKSEATLNKVLKINKDINVTTFNAQVVNESDIIILCVKPWQLEDVLQELVQKSDIRSKIVISVVAAKSFDVIENIIGADTPLFRVIPNTAIAVDKGMTFIATRNTTSVQDQCVQTVFDSMGESMFVSEQMLEAGTSLSSCGIAFALKYLQSAIVAGMEEGFERADSRAIVLQTMRGALALLEENGTTPQEEIDKVTTPGGLTLKGLEAMENKGFTLSVIEGVKQSKP
ncbi:MAG: pyrroline-5-carboxylate reductase [Marinifilaceae bacterium]